MTPIEQLEAEAKRLGVRQVLRLEQDGYYCIVVEVPTLPWLANPADTGRHTVLNWVRKYFPKAEYWHSVNMPRSTTQAVFTAARVPANGKYPRFLFCVYTAKHAKTD